MDSNLQSPPSDGSNTKRAFRKPSNDAANRKYRRRSPVGVSSSSEGEKYGELEAYKDKDQNRRAPLEKFEKSIFSSENAEFPDKKPKHHYSSDKATNHDKDADEKQAPSLDQAQEVASRGTAGEVHSIESEATNDLNPAKVAAMKAAELVNKNLVGVGLMTTDQKKKLLWGDKKNTTTEETGHRWDTALFGDSERQEKFNKLMGVKGELKVEPKPDNQDGSGLLHAEKQKELQLDLEKQYTAGLGRRDGRTVGLGL